MMHYMKHFGSFLSLFVACLFVACNDPEADSLRDKMQQEYELEKSDKASRTKTTKNQYKEIEFSYNQKYVSDLEDLLDNSFESQLDKFEDEELGFWRSLVRPFSYIFTSKTKRVDKMELKSQHYFNNLDVENEALTLFCDYTNDVKALRTRYTNSRYSLAEQPRLNLPEIDINLSATDNHARAEIIIDALSDVFGWFLAFIILNIIGLFVTCVGGWVVEVVILIATLAVGIPMSIHNDNKLLDNLREQHQTTVTTDYDNILNNLNKNTTCFYDKM